MRRMFALVVFALTGFTAAVTAGEEPQIEKLITARLAEVVPDMKVNGVRPAPVPGWYEVLLGAKLVYVSADARYVLEGTLMDLKEQKTLPRSRRWQRVPPR